MGLNVAGADVIEVWIILDVINVIAVIGFIQPLDVIIGMDNTWKPNTKYYSVYIFYGSESISQHSGCFGMLQENWNI